MIPNLESLAPLLPECALGGEQIERVELALAEPAELRLDLTGSFTLTKAQCVLDGLARRELLGRMKLQATSLSGGVRIATPGAVGDGPGGAAALTQRFDELASQSSYVLVTDVAPDGGLYELWSTAQNSAEARLSLPSRDAAAGAEAWLQAALAASSDPTLKQIGVQTRESSLFLRLPEPNSELATTLKRELLEVLRTPSGSMQPTLVPGDHVLVLKSAHDRAAAPGDLVAFASPREPSQVFLKRVIGVAGDRVQIDGYAIRVNGVALESALDASYSAEGPEAASGELWREALGAHHYRTLRDAAHHTDEHFDVKVEPEQVFVLGDNRDNSFDSRHFGGVDVKLLRGRAVMIAASLGEQGVRWERFGSGLD